jgi:uncharacterized protein YkwD
MRRFLPAFAVMVLLGLTPLAPAAERTRNTALVLTLINEARAQGRFCGDDHYPPAPPLNTSTKLERAARSHAADMARRNYFDHTAPDGSAPKQRVQREGYSSQLTGENIAFGPESAQEAVAGWLASPGHCANIMDARFQETGIGIAHGRKRGHIYWVQVFGWPRSSK